MVCGIFGCALCRYVGFGAGACAFLRRVVELQLATLGKDSALARRASNGRPIDGSSSCDGRGVLPRWRVMGVLVLRLWAVGT